jgi:hypothetical protein
MRIGLDIDGVVADFTGAINTAYEWWFGEECPIVWNEWDSYKMADQFPTWADCSVWADKARIWERMPFLPGAPAGIDRLLHQGHQLVFLTARSSPECVAQTKWWFEREIADRFGLSLDRLYTGLHQSKHTIPCTVYVDDGPDELAALKREGRSTIRFEHALNLRRPATAKVKSWKELTNLTDGWE